MVEQIPIRNADENIISFSDIIQFIIASYKKILLLGLVGLLASVWFTYAFGLHTATFTYLNYLDSDVIRIKYLQSALPKLAQEESAKGNSINLGSESLWQSAIKIKSLVGKFDLKDLIDPTSLKSSRFNIYAIEIVGKANAKHLAEKRVHDINNFFISGTIFIDLRDLLRQYELFVNATNSELATKTLNAEVDLAYIDRRIKDLTELIKKYPASATSINYSLQIIDGKDSAVKYLPILTQLIAATADKNNQKELLLRHKEEAAQMLIYSSFLEKAKPFMDAGPKDANLIANLLGIIAEASKEVNADYEKVTLSVIDGDLKKILSFKLYGLTQAGVIISAGPAYLKNTIIGLFGGVIIGILLALGLLVAKRFRAEMKSAQQHDRT